MTATNTREHEWRGIACTLHVEWQDGGYALNSGAGYAAFLDRAWADPELRDEFAAHWPGEPFTDANCTRLAQEHSDEIEAEVAHHVAVDSEEAYWDARAW